VVNAPVQAGTVLLVDASQNTFQPEAPAQPIVTKDVSSYYIDALKAIGEPYTLWDEAKLGSPSYDDMKTASAVIYFTGANLAGFSPQNKNEEALDGPLSPLDTSAMHSYLDAGGRVFVTGEGVPLSDPYWAAFVMGTEEASASLYDNDTNDKAHKGGISPPQPSAIPDTRVGVHSNPYIFAGMKPIDFSTKGDGAGTNTAVYSSAVASGLGEDMFGVNGLTPVYGDISPFGHAYGEAALRTTALNLVTGGSTATGDSSAAPDVAIVSSDEPSFTHKVSYKGRSVLFSFGFEGINDNTGYATREQVLKRIFQWFTDKPTATVSNTTYQAKRSVVLKAVLHAGSGIHAEAYTWRINGRTVKGGARGVTYTFPSSGTYTLRVQIMDSLGHVAVSTARTVRVS
jgi:hypothetical protein